MFLFVQVNLLGSPRGSLKGTDLKAKLGDNIEVKRRDNYYFEKTNQLYFLGAGELGDPAIGKAVRSSGVSACQPFARDAISGDLLLLDSLTGVFFVI